eukprot:6223037-Prymnesium_polylepis.1
MVDNLLDALDDVAGTISKVPKDERAESAKSGAITNAFSYIEAFMAKHGRDGFAVGDSLTIADLAVFVAMGSAVGTIFDNMTPSMLEPYPTVIAVRKQVANDPKVVEWFGQQETKDFWKQELFSSGDRHATPTRTVRGQYEIGREYLVAWVVQGWVAPAAPAGRTFNMWAATLCRGANRQRRLFEVERWVYIHYMNEIHIHSRAI